MMQIYIIFILLFSSISCYMIKIPPGRVVQPEKFETSRLITKSGHVPIELSHLISHTIIRKTGDCNCAALEYGTKNVLSPYHECQIVKCHNNSRPCWGSVEPSLTNGNENDTKCEGSSQSSGNVTIFCLCAYVGSKLPTNKVIRSFSLRAQESDVKKNMIVTGVKFSLKNTMIHLEIKQAELLIDGSVSDASSWKELGDIGQMSKSSDPAAWKDLIPGQDYISFTYDLRAMFLDEIHVPDGYVVTGVRLTQTYSPYFKPGIKLQVKGTQFKSLSHKLRPATDRWFDYENGAELGDSYQRPREEIPLDNCDAPSLATNNVEKGTNKLVMFRATDIEKNSGGHVIPFLNSEPATVGNQPMHGVGLFYAGQDGFGGFVNIKVFHRTDPNSNCVES